MLPLSTKTNYMGNRVATNIKMERKRYKSCIFMQITHTQMQPDLNRVSFRVCIVQALYRIAGKERKAGKPWEETDQRRSMAAAVCSYA